MMLFFRKGDEKASETLFAGYVPISMIRDMLKEKKLYDGGFQDL
jgi:hypothetical protein